VTEEEHLRRSLEDWNERGIDGLLEHLAPDVEWHAPPDYPDGQVWYGRKAIGEALRAQFGAVFSDSWVEITEMAPGPKGWFVGMHQTGHAQGSGVDLEWKIFQVFRLEGDRAKVVRTFFDRSEARRAAGLGDGPA
jgi:ketosteroid isomerase-like protein